MKPAWDSLCKHKCVFVVCVFVCACLRVCVCVWVPEILFAMCTCLPGAVHWPTGIGMDVIANICSAVVAMNVTWESATASRTMLCSLLERSYGTVSWWGIWTVSHLYSKDKHPIRRVACRLLSVALLGIQEVTHMCACVCARACVLMCCVFVCLCVCVFVWCSLKWWHH